MTSVEALVNLSESDSDIISAKRSKTVHLPEAVIKSIDGQIKALEKRRGDAQKVWDTTVDRLLAADSWPVYPASEARQKLDREYAEMVKCVHQLKATATQLKEGIDNLNRDDPSLGHADPTAMNVDGDYGPPRPLETGSVPEDPSHPTPLEREHVLGRITELEINYTTMTDYYDGALLKDRMETMKADELEKLKLSVVGRLDHTRDSLNFGDLEEVISATQEEMQHLASDVEAVDKEFKEVDKDLHSVKQEHTQWKQAFATVCIFFLRTIAYVRVPNEYVFRCENNSQHFHSRARNT